MSAAGREGDSCGSPEWRRLRGRLLTRLARDAGEGLVDSDILDVLVSVNSCPLLATSSSCSGRIALIAAPAPGDKKRGGVVARWHRRVRPEELRSAAEEALAGGHGFVWVSAQPVMLELYSCRLDVALEVVGAAVRLGFKYSGVRPSRNGFYVVHIASTERIDVPLRGPGGLMVEPGEALAELLNSYLTLTKARLGRLRRLAAVVAVLCGVGVAGEDATLPGGLRGP